MTTNILKSELTKAIAGINDKAFLEALFTIVHNKVEPFEHQLSDADLAIIEERRKAYRAGKSKTVTVGEMRKRFSGKFSS